MEKVRVGIVGTSWWADTMYLPSLAGTRESSTYRPLLIDNIENIKSNI